MPDILNKIIEDKIKEVATRKSLFPVALLEKSIFFKSPCISMKKYLRREDKNGIIAEIKRKSPSKGEIKSHINVEELSIGYMQAGASALSILTDEQYFGGTNQDLMTARKFNYCPILRKDFIIDEYQLFESRAWGADVVLLIASAITPEKCRQLSLKAKELNMEVLLEVHNELEIRLYDSESIDIIGVNNRNLKNFETSLERSIELAALLPKEKLKISESGIRTSEDILTLRAYGYNGFLIGDSFMRSAHPQEACKQLITELNNHKILNHAKA